MKIPKHHKDDGAVDISAVNVALVRLLERDDEEAEKERAHLRDHRVEAGLERTMSEAERIVALNEVSKADMLEGEPFMELFEAVKRAEAVATEPERKLFESAPVMLSESMTVNDDGTINICLITPGWGSSGYYSEDLLKSSVGVFPRGLHQYWDHPTISEEYQRPERSLRDLAAVLSENATWEDQGFKGPGIYSKSKVFSPYMESLSEMAPHIGLSVVVYGTSHLGDAEGETGEIIDAIVAARSVDFVTLPGRGGAIEAKFEGLRESTRIRQLVEAGKQTAFYLERTDLSHDSIRELLWNGLRDKLNSDAQGYDPKGPFVREVYDDYVVYVFDGKNYKASYVIDQTGETSVTIGDATEVVVQWVPVNESDREEDNMGEAELKKENEDLQKQLQEKENELARHAEVRMEADAKKFAEKVLGDIESIPEATKARLAEAVSAKPPTKDGKLDEDAFKATIEDAVKKEAAYLADLGYGKPDGLGPSVTKNEESAEELKARLSESFKAIIGDDAKAATAAAGRVR